MLFCIFLIFLNSSFSLIMMEKYMDSVSGEWKDKEKRDRAAITALLGTVKLGGYTFYINSFPAISFKIVY